MTEFFAVNAPKPDERDEPMPEQEDPYADVYDSAA
jgi:hypothetical protein